VCNERHEVLLERRPSAGIWGGLWSFPEMPPGHDVGEWCRTTLGVSVRDRVAWPVVRHTFTHFHLDITPVRARVKDNRAQAVLEAPGQVWYNAQQPDHRGLAAPVQRLLDRLNASKSEQGEP